MFCRGDRVSPAIHILNEPHGSNPRSSYVRGNASPQNSAFRVGYFSSFFLLYISVMLSLENTSVYLLLSFKLNILN